jgi:PIN domain nuclease of toxin-antitoxin system
VHRPGKLSLRQIEEIKKNEGDIIGISAISCWETAKLVEYNRLKLPLPLHEWFEKALSYPAMQMFNLTPEISIESTRLPGEFHRDPADQIIVATARTNKCPLITSDHKILNYPYVDTIE